jgi:LmbE family N-acetylglucosaminyl deacetylase
VVTEFAANRIDRPGTGEKAWRSWPGLRLPDTAVAAHEDELAGLLRELCAGFAVCLAPWARDAHADHEAAGRAARRAGAADGRTVLSYPIWMWHWAKPADPRVPWHQACRVPLPAGVAARRGQRENTRTYLAPHVSP